MNRFATGENVVEMEAGWNRWFLYSFKCFTHPHLSWNQTLRPNCALGGANRKLNFPTGILGQFCERLPTDVESEDLGGGLMANSQNQTSCNFVLCSPYPLFLCGRRPSPGSA